MLVGFSGPSAVGKTTIMRCLADLHEWKFVRVATTRPIRERESEKFQVSRDNYESMQANGKFWCSNTLFGNSYGTLKLDIEASASSDGIFMLDWPIAKIQSLQQVANLIFLIKPESEEQLVKQILASARSNRMDAIISALFAPKLQEGQEGDGRKKIAEEGDGGRGDPRLGQAAGKIGDHAEENGGNGDGEDPDKRNVGPAALRGGRVAHRSSGQGNAPRARAAMASVIRAKAAAARPDMWRARRKP